METTNNKNIGTQKGIDEKVSRLCMTLLSTKTIDALTFVMNIPDISMKDDIIKFAATNYNPKLVLRAVNSERIPLAQSIKLLSTAPNPNTKEAQVVLEPDNHYTDAVPFLSYQYKNFLNNEISPELSEREKAVYNFTGFELLKNALDSTKRADKGVDITLGLSNDELADYIKNAIIKLLSEIKFDERIMYAGGILREDFLRNDPTIVELLTDCDVKWLEDQLFKPYEEAYPYISLTSILVAKFKQSRFDLKIAMILFKSLVYHIRNLDYKITEHLEKKEIVMTDYVGRKFGIAVKRFSRVYDKVIAKRYVYQFTLMAIIDSLVIIGDKNPSDTNTLINILKTLLCESMAFYKNSVKAEFKINMKKDLETFLEKNPDYKTSCFDHYMGYKLCQNGRIEFRFTSLEIIQKIETLTGVQYPDDVKALFTESK